MNKLQEIGFTRKRQYDGAWLDIYEHIYEIGGCRIVDTIIFDNYNKSFQFTQNDNGSKAGFIDAPLFEAIGEVIAEKGWR